ncbi:MAG: hypothetical protein U0271_24345 [Polyangiaceae bacterium]
MRRAGYSAERPAGTGVFDLSLLNDPVARPGVIEQMRKQGAQKTLDVSAWPAFVDALRARLLPEALASSLLSDTLPMVGAAQGSLRTRPDHAQHEFLVSLLMPERPTLPAPESDPHSDDLDVVFGQLSRPMHERPALLSVLLHNLNVARQRAGSAAWQALLRSSEPAPALVAAAVLFAPRTVGSPHLPRAPLRRALDAVLGVAFLVDGDLLVEQAKAGAFDHPDGGLDLGVANVLFACAPSGFALLLKTFGVSSVARAITLRPEESAGIVLLPIGTSEELGPLFEALGGLDASVARRLLELFLERALASRLPFVVGLPGFEAALADWSAPVSAARQQELAKVLAEHFGERALEVALRLAAGRAASLGRVLLVEVAARESDTAQFVATIAALPEDDLLHVLEAANTVGFPAGKTLALAYALDKHGHPEVAAWVLDRLPRPVSWPVKRQRQGVAYRSIPRPLGVKDCVDLLGSADPIEATDAAFASAGTLSPAFLAELDTRMVTAFGLSTNEPLSPLGHAWLWRWDAHALAHLELTLAEHGSLARGLEARAGLRSQHLRDVALAALASALAVLAARESERFRALADEAFADALIVALDGPGALEAAEMLALVHARADVDASRVVARVRARLPDLAEDVRARLMRIVDASGLVAARPKAPLPPSPDEAAAIELAVVALRTASIDVVDSALDDPRPRVVEEAVLLLAALGEIGRDRLAARIERHASARAEGDAVLKAVVASVPLWDAGPALDRVIALALRDTTPSPVAFRLSMALASRGGDGARELALHAARCARRVDETGWFERADFDELVRVVGDKTLVAVELAAAPHPFAYLPAVESLLAAKTARGVREGLLTFLEQGTLRMGSLRRLAAKRLAELGDLSGLPVLMPRGLEEADGLPLAGASPDVLRDTVRSLLAAGTSIAKEPPLMKLLGGLPRSEAAPGFAEVLEHGATDKARVAAATALSRYESRAAKLVTVARTFLWGARLARKLLGRTIRVRITGSRKLGFTRGDANEIFVSPVPIFSGDPNGRDVVEGLILHELGHHLYHGGDIGRATWLEAKKLGIHGLFNLVADEHLERNLRAIDASYGDRLKRLAAYAFQRTQRDVPVLGLVRGLGSRAFEVLVRAELGLAREPDRVRLESGQLLFGMERSGLSFARFARGLRMGLGNRHDDPRVARALELFGSRFRHATMPELLEIAKQLKQLFGWEADMAESTFGPHEAFEDGLAGEEGASAEGITQEDIDRLVERITDPRMLARGSGVGGGKLAINVSEDTKYDLIKQVEHRVFDRVAHAALAAKVRRPASILRRYLEELGLATVPRNMRTTGVRIDRARLKSMVLTRDPRVLVTRERVVRRDLFIAVVIDCSGSMQTRGNIERAKLFAALVAEAVAPLSGVDARFFGFTDQFIFDCGDARRPAVHTLVANGGNNDAGALDHVARVAQASKRRAKVIIMVSDGLPTECSVAALKNLVRSITTRQRYVVAQVAVQPITEICFPHYVLLQDAETDTVVRRFGALVARLVRGALAG